MNNIQVDFTKLPIQAGDIVRLKTWDELLAEGYEVLTEEQPDSGEVLEYIQPISQIPIRITQDICERYETSKLVVAKCEATTAIFNEDKTELTDEDYATMDFMVSAVYETEPPCPESGMFIGLLNTMLKKVDMFVNKPSTKVEKLWNINPNTLYAIQDKAREVGIDKTKNFVYSRRNIAVTNEHALPMDSAKRDAAKIRKILDIFPVMANLACLEHNMTTEKNGVRVLTTIPELFGQPDVANTMTMLSRMCKNNDYDSYPAGNPSIALYLTSRDKLEDAYEKAVADIEASENDAWKNDPDDQNLFLNHTATKYSFSKSKNIATIKNTKKLVIMASLEDFVEKTTVFDVLEIIHKTFSKETDDIFQAVKTANIDGILAQINDKAEEKRMRVVMKSLEIVGNKYADMKKERLARVIDELKVQEQAAIKAYQDICNNIENQQKEIFLVSNGYKSQNFTDFSELILANKHNVAHLNTDRFETHGELAIQIIQDILYYNEDDAEIVRDNSVRDAFNHGNCIPEANKERLTKLLIAITETRDITCVSQTSVILKLTNTGVAHDGHGRIPYKWSSMVGIPNPHIKRFNCWGANENHIIKALSECNLVMAYNQVCASLAGINVVDQPVYSEFVNNLATTGGPAEYRNIPCLRDNATGETFSIVQWYKEKADDFKLSEKE